MITGRGAITMGRRTMTGPKGTTTGYTARPFERENNYSFENLTEAENPLTVRLRAGHRKENETAHKN